MSDGTPSNTVSFGQILTVIFCDLGRLAILLSSVPIQISSSTRDEKFSRDSSSRAPVMTNRLKALAW